MISNKVRKVNEKEEIATKNKEASDKMIGKWEKCGACSEIIYKEELHQNFIDFSI